MPWPTAHIPISNGLEQKADPRSIEPPQLAVCKNVEFEEVGGTQKRKPFSTMPGQSKPSDIRRLAVVDGELLAFTKTDIRSYSPALDSWEDRGDYLAPHVEEKVFFDGTKQQQVCARAELDGIAVWGWTEGSDGNTILAGVDSTTGAVVAGPTTISGEIDPILIALDSRIALFTTKSDESETYIRMLLPSNLDSSTAGEGFSGSVQKTYTGGGYPVATRIPNADKCAYYVRENVGNDLLGILTGGSSGAPSFSENASIYNATFFDVAVAPDGQILVVRADATDCRGDLYNADGTDNALNTQVSTLTTSTVDKIVAEFRSDATAGEYTADILLSVNETATATTTYIQHNTFDTAGSAGTPATRLTNLAVASRPISWENSTYFWAVFGDNNIAAGSMALASGFSAQLQNTYLLCRSSDGEVVAKASQGTARADFNSNVVRGSQEVSPGVFVFALAQNRRTASATNLQKYGAARPLEVRVFMDSNKARRVQQIGRTGYISGGQITQYDGTRPTEVGFHIYPWSLNGSVAGSGGSLSSGSYTYRATYRWVNGKGEIERSTTATYCSITAAANDKATITISPTSMTRKKGTGPDAIAVELWRTQVNPAAGADFYLVTDINPTNTSNPNRYLDNDETAQMSASVEDDEADTAIADNEGNPENGAVLESVAPPPASIILAGQDRVFLAGIAGLPYTVYYSRLRSDGEVVSFNDQLYVDLPSASGEITGLATLNETLVVFCKKGIYMLPGDGYDNSLLGQNYGPARLLSVDVGAESAESIAVIPEGIIFRSQKGWYALDRGWSVRYIGGSVSDYDAEEIVSVLVLEKQHQVRVATTSRILVWDTLIEQWSEWDQAGITGSVIWNGKHVISTDTDVLEQRLDYDSDVQYAFDVETAWIKPNGLQGFVRGRKLSLLGEYRGSCRVRVRVAYDYDEVDGAPNWVDDKSWTPSPSTEGGPLRVKHRFTRQRFSAFKVRITDEHPTIDGDPAETEAFRLTGLSLEYAAREGLRNLPAAQKQ